MTTTHKEPVLQIQRLRNLYGHNGLSRAELANLALIPVQLLVAYESCSALPVFFAGLVRVAFALQVPLEELVDPSRLRQIRVAIARRRVALEGGAPNRCGVASHG